ncbi:DNA topoisomerase 2 [Camellia lanceoleosa]|uniref:DNA topoisomerase 2 n=1 Tax=Camellia lanceoleosa TaxID=1840588 RepID=A0ACC0FCC3_9ERIC|nr:DNA topoisomerase 2 [Camellia lanceoleosa]
MVTIDVEQNCISVYNNGDGVPVEIHQEEEVYVPEMIFGHLLTSNNYDDSMKKTTSGRNGYGAKLTNIFSTEFVIETADGKRQKKYKQVKFFQGCVASAFAEQDHSIMEKFSEFAFAWLGIASPSLLSSVAFPVERGFDTGGSGSCLKRYTDPTIFRRASARSGEASVEKISKDRKARRSKKKRTWQRNEASRGASISNRWRCILLLAFVSIGVENGWSSIDERGQSNSSDSRTEIGYIECVFHPTYSMEPEEHEPKESSLSCLRIHHNETVDSASVDEHSGVVDDDFAHSLLEEQTGPISSFVTWDEKTEILDDIESEIDNFVDTLNIIESESETDLDCQTKREVKKSSNLNEEGTQEDGVHGLAADHSNLQPSNLESHIADFSNTNNVTSSDKPNSISSQFYANEESHQMVGESSDISNSLSINFCENDDVVDGSNVESGICNYTTFELDVGRSHVWGHFCLCYEGQKLINDKDYIRNFGIKDGDQRLALLRVKTLVHLQHHRQN